MMRRLALASLVFVLAACSGSAPARGPAVTPGPPLEIQAPPSGTLTARQLAAVAEDIRELEQNPFGQGAPDARASLVRWLTGSPDVHAMLCQGVTEPLLDSNSRYHSELLAHYILGMGQHLIETPEDDGDAAAISLGGMLGALRAYESMLALDPSGTDRFMDQMLTRRDAGTLATYVAERTRGCS